MLAKGLVVHKEVQHLAILALQPINILVGGQRVLVPALVREAECDIVAQLVVTQQKAQLLVDSVSIYVVGALPTHHVARALGQHSLEAHLGYHLTDLIRVDQLGVTESGRFLTELLLDQCSVSLNLAYELLLIGQRSQRVRVGLGQELNATRFSQLLERLQNFGSVLTELVDSGTGDRERHLKCALMLLNQIEQERVHRQIAQTCNLLHNRLVGQIIQIVMVFAHIKEAVLAQTKRLMYLKIKTDCFHCMLFFYFCYITDSYTALTLAAALSHFRPSTSSRPFCINIFDRAG